MAGEKNKNSRKGKTVYVSLPASRRARSGGQMKTDDRVKASAEKTVRRALVEGRGTLRLGPNTQVYVGGLIPTVHPEHVAALFAGCGRILNIEFVCTRGTANLQKAPLPPVPPEPIPGQLPTPRRTMRPRYLEQNEVKEQRQTWLYAIVKFDDAAAATRALVKNGVTLRGVENTKCVVRVVPSSSDLEETRMVEYNYAFGRVGRFPSAYGLKREATEVINFHGRTEFSLVELALRAQEQSKAPSSKSAKSDGSSETLKLKATADRLRWLGTEATVRPGQLEAMKGWWDAFQNRLHSAMCGISFKTTIA